MKATTHKVGVISLSVIGVAAVLMVITAPTFENQQASAVSQPVVKKVGVKDPPSKKSKILLGKDSSGAAYSSAGSVFVAWYQYISGDQHLDIQELDHQ